jgi:hypothetical protein
VRYLEPGFSRPSLLVRRPKTGILLTCSVNLMRVLRHVKRLLRGCSGLLRTAQDSTATAQGCLLIGPGSNSECSGLATELAFGEVTFSSYVNRYIAPIPSRASSLQLLPISWMRSDIIITDPVVFKVARVSRAVFPPLAIFKPIWTPGFDPYPILILILILVPLSINLLQIHHPFSCAIP